MHEALQMNDKDHVCSGRSEASTAPWAALQAQTALRKGGLHEAKYERLHRKNSRERRVGY